MLTDPIVKHVHPTMTARTPAFLKSRREDVITMLDALARGDFETVERLGHCMKGAGASFGFQAITDIGAALEQEAGRSDSDASRQQIGELSMYLDRVGPSAAGPGRLLPSDTRAVTAGCRIVLVEDNEDMRVIFRAVLERSGHHVQEAQNGIEGLASILAEKPDVAIIDMGLPGMDGYEVARQVRAALGPSILLIAMTGYGEESARLKALAAGFDKHLTKPVDIALHQKDAQAC